MQMMRSKDVEEELRGGDGDEDWGTNVWEKNERMGCYEEMCPNSSQLNLIVTPAMASDKVETQNNGRV